jgi:hypothetical protein
MAHFNRRKAIFRLIVLIVMDNPFLYVGPNKTGFNLTNNLYPPFHFNL